MKTFRSVMTHLVVWEESPLWSTSEHPVGWSEQELEGDCPTSLRGAFSRASGTVGFVSSRLEGVNCFKIAGRLGYWVGCIYVSICQR